MTKVECATWDCPLPEPVLRSVCRPEFQTLDREAARVELVEAREAIRENLWRVENPLRFTDANPQLAAKLRGMLAEVEQSLAEMDGNSA
jgi:hypothetical protein